jgi:hypothetical protein
MRMKFFSWKGVLRWHYQPQRVLLDLNVQPLKLNKTTMEGVCLTDANLEPCTYQILITMGRSKKVQWLTKHEVIIQVNPIKLANYFMNIDHKSTWKQPLWFIHTTYNKVWQEQLQKKRSHSWMKDDISHNYARDLYMFDHFGLLTRTF